MARLRTSLRVDRLVIVSLLAAGVAVGLTWRALHPLAVRVGDTGESMAAGDALLAALGLPAGVVTGALTLVRPGRQPLHRTTVAIVGSALAASLAWGAGRAAGAPALHAIGAAFVWPVVTTAVIFIYTAVASVLAPRALPQAAALQPGEGGDDGPREPHEVAG